MAIKAAQLDCGEYINKVGKRGYGFREGKPYPLFNTAVCRMHQPWFAKM